MVTINWPSSASRIEHFKHYFYSELKNPMQRMLKIFRYPSAGSSIISNIIQLAKRHYLESLFQLSKGYGNLLKHYSAISGISSYSTKKNPCAFGNVSGKRSFLFTTNWNL